jgi:hypothetical protein
MIFTLRYKVTMKKLNHSIAILDWLLVFPGALFMTALFVRNLQPTQYEPARTALRLVNWFSARPFLGLDVFLIALPLAAFVIGFAAIWRVWHTNTELRQAALKTLGVVNAHLGAFLTAIATLVAGTILFIIALTSSLIERAASCSSLFSPRFAFLASLFALNHRTLAPQAIPMY